MKSLRPILAAIALLALAGCEQKPAKPAAPAAATETVGLNAEIDNDVQQKSVSEPAFRGAVLQGPVRYADDILTAVDSRLLVRLKDNSALTVGPNARISIDKFVIDTDATVPSAAVSVAKGAFRFASGAKGSRPDGVRFNTPLAAIGIRGTILEGVVGPDALNVIGPGPWLAILSLDPETATVIVLREGIIEIRFGDEVITLDEPGDAIALGGTRRSTVFKMSGPATGRLDALLAPRGVGPRPPAAPAADTPPGVPPTTTPPTGGKAPPPRQPPPRRDPAGGAAEDNYSHDNEAVGGSGGGGRPTLTRSDGSPVPPSTRSPSQPPPRTYGAPLPRRDRGPGTPDLTIPLPSGTPSRDRQPTTQPKAPARDGAPSTQLQTQPAPTRAAPATAKEQPAPTRAAPAPAKDQPPQTPYKPPS